MTYTKPTKIMSFIKPYILTSFPTCGIDVFVFIFLCFINLILIIMKKLFYVASFLGLSVLMSACMQKSSLPQNPKDKEEYRDKDGNRWVYNSSGNFWMVYALMSSMNQSAGTTSGYAASPSYRYYPANNSWTNGTGTTRVTPAAKLANTAAGSYRNAGTSATKTQSSSPAKSSSGKSFSVGRSHSFGA